MTAATALPGLRAPRWWQWPTILSLDAPAVALAWQQLIAREARAPLHAHHALLLGASVWLAYAADRWIEGWTLAPDAVRTQRHAFYVRRRWTMLAVWSAVLCAGVGLAFAALTQREWFASLVLLAAILAYLLSHQFAHRSRRGRVPKEICVAALFASGATLYPALHATGRLSVALAAGGILGALAFANCLLISGWERDVDRSHGRSSLALDFPVAGQMGRWAALALAVIAAAAALRLPGDFRRLGTCATTSGLLLHGLDWCAPRLGRERARVLADVALLTPWLAWLLP